MNNTVSAFVLRHPTAGALRFEIVDVTPTIAASWLKKNSHNNRPLRPTKVDAYKRDMAAGNWRLTHQCIAFNKGDVLVDGQHRLQAVIAAGRVVPLLVCSGIDLSYDDPIDVGANRSAGNIMHISNGEAAALRCLRMLEKGMKYRKGSDTVSELMETKERHSEGFDFARDALLSRPAVGIRISGWTVGAIAFAYPCNTALVRDFAESYRTGELLVKGDPAYALRARAHGRGETSVNLALIACGALRFALMKDKANSLAATPAGYRWICTRRRQLGIPGTPDADTVDSLYVSETFEERQARKRA